MRETEEKTDVISEKESAEALLRRLIEEDDPRTENARYVLAVMLERKRTLKEVERKDAENGSRLLIYEHPKTGDVLIVRDPMLRLDEIEPVQAEVSALLAPKPAAEAAAGEVDAGGEEREVAAEADEGKKSPAEGAGGVEN